MIFGASLPACFSFFGRKKLGRRKRKKNTPYSVTLHLWRVTPANARVRRRRQQPPAGGVLILSWMTVAREQSRRRRSSSSSSSRSAQRGRSRAERLLQEQARRSRASRHGACLLVGSGGSHTAERLSGGPHSHSLNAIIQLPSATSCSFCLPAFILPPTIPMALHAGSAAA